MFHLNRWYFRLGIVLASICVAVSCSLPSLGQEITPEQKAEKISKVELSLEFIGDKPSEVVIDRLYKAIYTSLETAIIEQLEADLKSVEADKDQIVEILTGILNLVLPRRGYKISSFQLEPGQITKVIVILEQFSQVIKQYDIELIIERQALALDASREADAAELQKLLKNNLNNVPYSDTNFARQSIENYLKDNWLNKSPWDQFEASLEIIPGEKTVIRIKLTPLKRVSRLHYSFAKVRSTSLINLTIAPLRSKFSTMISDLDGLPTIYLHPRLHYVGEAIMKLVQQDKISRKLKVTGNVDFFTVEDRLFAVLNLESSAYFLESEAKINFNVNDREAQLSAMLGLKANEMTFYSGLSLYPGLMDTGLEIGMAYNSFGTFVGGAWDFSRETFKARLKQQLFTDFEIDIEAFFTEKHRDDSIYTVRYRFGDNYSLGVALDNDGKTQIFVVTSL